MTDEELPLYVERLGPEPRAGADVFVLVHGYGGSMFTWRHWAPRLAERGHVVQIDLKGFGRAPRPDDGRYAPSDQAVLVRRLIEQLDLRDVTLLGHSLGGGVALLVALQLLAADPTRLRRLVLVAGAAYMQRLPPFVTLADWPRVSGSLFKLAGARRVVSSALRAIVYDADRVTDAQIDGYARPLASPEAFRVLLVAAQQVLPPDLPTIVRRYPRITVPTLLLWGREDRVVPVSVGERLVKDLPDARLRILERCGHLPAEERPDASYALLERFLDDTSPRHSASSDEDAGTSADDSPVSR